MNTNCHVCNAKIWIPLPDPVGDRSVTTSARIVEQPLGKSICLHCGLTQRVRADFLGTTLYYETEYASYYERPGTEEYHNKRCQQLVDWMIGFLPERFEYKNVLDVGCGQGWAMDTFAAKFKNINIDGIEPSVFNAAIARKKGHRVFEGKIEKVEIDSKYDLIYSNNVIQHVNDAKTFISDLMKLLKSDGIIIVTCPDGSRPNIELFFSDHNYSLLPSNMITMGKELGFGTVFISKSEENPSLPPAQLLLLTNNEKYQKYEYDRQDFTGCEITTVVDDKKSYIGSIKDLGDYILREISAYSRIYNFGASFWTSVLAGYCQNYWEKVTACVVDTYSGGNKFMGKEIMELKNIPEDENTVIVLGTSPATHDILFEKLRNRYKVLRWDSYYRY